MWGEIPLSWEMWYFRGQVITQTPHVKARNTKKHQRTERCISFLSLWSEIAIFPHLKRERERSLAIDKRKVQTHFSFAGAGVRCLTWSVLAPVVCFLSCSCLSQTEPQRTAIQNKKEKKREEWKWKDAGECAMRGTARLRLQLLSSPVVKVQKHNKNGKLLSRSCDNLR